MGRTWSRAGRGAQRNARETRKCSQTRQNQSGKAQEPRGPCFFSGRRSTINRSFAGLILNNTPPALGDNSSLRLNLVSRKIHWRGRQSQDNWFLTGTRMRRQPHSVSATQLPSETSSRCPSPCTSSQVLCILPQDLERFFSRVRPRLLIYSTMLKAC